MQQIKNNTLPFDRTIDIAKVIGKKVLTNDGKRMGKIKGLNIHPTDLTIEGIRVDTGMFEVNQYIDGNYIQALSNDGAVLKTTPVTEFIGLSVFDSMGKKVGKVTEVNRSRMTNSLTSMKVKLSDSGKEVMISSDYISACGKSCMLREPWDMAS